LTQDDSADQTNHSADKSRADEKSATLVPAEADGYCKVGPGPIAAIRFKWTVRRADNGDYFVDETIGENSEPFVSGPMTKDAAVSLVDECEREAHRRFDQLRAEMSGRGAALEVIQQGGGEF
jgi:hypothetical protein